MRKQISLIWPEALHEQWIEFEDENGIGCCQPDHFVVLDHCGIVFESKLTQTFGAVEQINNLYRPVLELIFSRPFLGVQCCKNLVIDPGAGLLHQPRMLPTFKPSRRVWTWHHLGS